MKKLMLVVVAFIFSLTMTLSTGFAEGDGMTSEDKIGEEKADKGDVKGVKGKKLGHKKEKSHPHGGPGGKALGHDKAKHKGEHPGKTGKKGEAVKEKAVVKEAEKKEPEVKEPEKREPEKKEPSIKDPRDRRMKKGIQ